MPTVEEVLKASGFTSEQISALDQKAVGAFSTVLTEATQAREAAELAQRSNADFYENQIAPSLVNWDAEKSKYDAELNFYRSQNQSLRDNGFLPADAAYQPRDAGGRYVAGVPGSTPGSPTFDVNKVYQRAGDAIGLLSDIQWEHQRLFNQPLPMSPSELVRQADAVKLDPRTFAARQFGWDQKRQEVAKAEQEKHDDAIRREATEAAQKAFAERYGSNPDMRVATHNPKLADISRAVRAGTRVDPLSMNESERRNATKAMIRDDLNEQAS
jgi:hypothetical protein